uniref:p2C62 n=1 Tax=Arundo donax TaxID=35708 RepID=A0A0A9BDY0_ARUDO
MLYLEPLTNNICYNLQLLIPFVDCPGRFLKKNQTQDPTGAGTRLFNTTTVVQFGAQQYSDFASTGTSQR